MYRLKVRVNKNRWITGKIEYISILEAIIRKAELEKLGIISVVVNADGSKLK